MCKILIGVKGQLKVQDTPIHFNVIRYKRFTDIISDYIFLLDQSVRSYQLLSVDVKSKTFIHSYLKCILKCNFIFQLQAHEARASPYTSRKQQHTMTGCGSNESRLFSTKLAMKDICKHETNRNYTNM